MLYFSYGSNLNRGAMARRCPGARPVGAARLEDYRLQFCGYANIIPASGSSVQGAVYDITEAHARALDDYEGDAYKRIDVTVLVDGQPRAAMAYAMKDPTPAAPKMDYYREIALGYRDWGIDEKILRRARYDTLNVGGAVAGPVAPNTPPRAPLKKRDIRWDPSQNARGDLEMLSRPPPMKKR